VFQLDPTTVGRITHKIRPIIERQVTEKDWPQMEGFLAAVVKAIWEEHLIYLSTGCLHGEHGHCCNSVSVEGEPKWPGHCKFCSSSCICPCHPSQPLLEAVGTA
jgi:hypothetical protein